jgi:hypothetical protein
VAQGRRLGPGRREDPRLYSGRSSVNLACMDAQVDPRALRGRCDAGWMVAGSYDLRTPLIGSPASSNLDR